MARYFSETPSTREMYSSARSIGRDNSRIGSDNRTCCLAARVLVRDEWAALEGYNRGRAGALASRKPSYRDSGPSISEYIVERYKDR